MGKEVFGSQQGLAQNFGNMANAWSGNASSSIAPVSNYWQQMLQGGKGAQNLVAPSAMQISDVYRGADRSMQNFLPAGGERNLARAQAGTEKARSIADLYANVQPYAASQLADIGFKQGVLAQGFGGMAQQGNANLIDYQSQRNAAKAASMGGIGAGLGALGGGLVAKKW